MYSTSKLEFKTNKSLFVASHPDHVGLSAISQVIGTSLVEVHEPELPTNCSLLIPISLTFVISLDIKSLKTVFNCPNRAPHVPQPK